MKTAHRDKLIRGGILCPYCGGFSTLQDSAVIYGTSYGPIWMCKPCDAYVGVHKGTLQSLGRLANAELREAKKQAHRYFDPLWRRKIELEGCSKGHARRAAYAWLCGRMELKAEICHIGMMDVEQCRQVVAICKSFYSHLSKNNQCQNQTTPTQAV